jgi:nucleoside-diphosphate-sugar epimerase
VIKQWRASGLAYLRDGCREKLRAMKALVTGGGGFLGKAIVMQLLARGDDVRTLARGDYPGLRERGVETHRGDVADADAVLRAVEGRDVVFHIAAKAGIWGTTEEYERANVQGTAHVIEACRKSGVERLVHASSPSVIGAGKPLEGVDESVPYPGTWEADYPRTKAIAEKAVLAANNPALRTVALRPHLIWGPGDTNLVPRIVARAKTGRLWKIGRGDALIDTTYIDNAAAAHILAADRLTKDSPVCGRVYFITNGEPVPVGEMIDRILGAAGLPPVRRAIPPALASAAGRMAELTWAALRRNDEPPMTRFLAHQLSTAHWFDISAAKRDLGYTPTVTLEEGFRRLAAELGRA